LELGIDIGDVNLVCQIGSTRSIASFLQRVGRSNHTVAGFPKGRIFPLSRDELVECASLIDAVRRGELDRLSIPELPLDILAQQIVATVAAEEWTEDALFAMVRRAFPYRNLERKNFDAVVRMLADGFSTKRGRRSTYLHHDAVNQRLRGRRGARLAAIGIVVGGIGAFLGSPMLSWRGKLRLMGEPLVPARRRPPEEDESIRSFAARRVGTEAADVMIDSLVSGIFAGDPARLSLRACFPKMYKMETEHGGLVKAMIAGMRAKRRGEGLSSLGPVPASGAPAASAASAAPTTAPGAADAPASESAPATSGGGMGMPAGKLTSFRGGIQDLIEGVARALGSSVRTGAEVASIARSGEDGRWTCLLASGERIEADAVVLAGPSTASARILSALDPALAAQLGAIEYASVAVVCLGFDPKALPRPLDGFGFLVPRGEGVRSLGVLWDSSIYPGRAPAGKALMRAMIGGARDPDAVEMGDTPLLETVLADLARTMGPFGTPELVRIFRHARGIPQYTLGHLERVDRMEAALRSHPGLFLAGNSYYGVAINSCIAGAGPLAGKIGAHLAAGRSGSVRSSMNA
jgi:oxygen-dependent protoporphyrinogen oxidase